MNIDKDLSSNIISDITYIFNNNIDKDLSSNIVFNIMSMIFNNNIINKISNDTYAYLIHLSNDTFFHFINSHNIVELKPVFYDNCDNEYREIIDEYVKEPADKMKLSSIKSFIQNEDNDVYSLNQLLKIYTYDEIIEAIDISD